jgi:cytochrome c553
MEEGMRRWLAAWLLALGAFVSPSAFAQNAANGQALYRSICILCHSLPPIGGAELGANNPALIRQAINGLVPAMQSVVGPFNFSDAQLADIAAYIAQVTGAAPPPPPPLSPPPPPPSTPAPPEPDPVPLHDYSDLWWNSAESGWGINLIQHPSNNIFAVMYTYDSTRRPLWFVLPGGHWATANKFTGTWYQVAGPSYAVPTFDSGAVHLSQVGTATLTFFDTDTGALSFTVNGVEVLNNITRQPY